MNASFAPNGSTSGTVSTVAPQITGTVTSLLSGATAVGTGTPQSITHRDRRYLFSLAGSGSVSATVKLMVSLDSVTWLTGATISLSSSTGADQYGFSAGDGWKYVRADVSAISGTSAAVSASVQE